VGAVVAGLVAASTLSPAPGAVAADPGPTGYAYATEWIYSTDASEVPQAVATDGSGRVYAVAPNSGYGDDKATVRAYDPNGGLVTQWEVPFPNVGDLVVDASGNVHVGDYSGDVRRDIPAGVYVYSPAGAYLRWYPMRPCCDVTETVGGIGIGPDGRSYVVSPTSDQIVVFNATGTRLKTFSGPGVAPGRLKSPWGLDVAPDGRVVVADRDNSRVQVFTAEGVYVTGWGQSGTGPGQFVTAASSFNVEVRDDGLVYVVDGTDRVQVFTLTGQYLGTVLATTKRSGDTMTGLSGVAFGLQRELYVGGKLFPFENGVAKYVLAGTGAGVAKVMAPKRGVPVTKRKVRLTVRCVSATPCAGTLTLTVKGRSIAKPKAYAVAPGGKAKVAVKLTKKGLKKVRKKPVTKAVASVTGGATKVKIRR